jgi:hypothetical protein
MITLNLVETKYKLTWLPNNTFQTPQSQHHISSGYRPCEHDRPRQEGWSLLVNQRTRARTQKNRNQIAESELNARSWGLTNRQAVKLFKTDWSKQNSNPKDDDGGCLIETRVSRDPLDAPYWAHTRYMAQGLKNGHAAPRSTMDAIVFRRFPSIPKELWHGTKSIVKVFSEFHTYIERTKRSPDEIWTSKLACIGLGLWDCIELEVGWASNSIWPSFLVLCTS